MKHLVPADLRRRMRTAAGNPLQNEVPPAAEPAWVGRWMQAGLAGLLAATCVIIYGIVLVMCARQGDWSRAERCFLTVNGMCLQAWFLWRIGPAFSPADALIRRTQLFMPIRQVTIVRRWFDLTRQTAAIGALAMTAFAGAMYACGISLMVVVTNLLWLFLVAVLAVRICHLCLSRRGNMGWFSTIAFWLYACLTFIGLQMIYAAHLIGYAEFFSGPTFLILMAPSVLASQFGDIAALATVVAIVLVCGEYRLPKPSRRRLQRICRSWRTLPDRESPEPRNLTFPRNRRKSELPLRDVDAGRESVARRIRSSLFCPNPTSMLDAGTRVRHRLLALLALVAYAALATFLDILNLMNLAPAPPNFASAAVLYHLPAMWGVCQAIPMLPSRVISAGGLLRIALRGLPSDTLVLAVLHAPSVYLIGRIGGDFNTPMTHVAECLLFAAAVRVAWIPLVVFQGEQLNASVAMFAGLITFVVGGLACALVEILFGWAVSDRVFIVPLLTSLVVFMVGWDRVAARIRPHIPESCYVRVPA